MKNFFCTLIFFCIPLVCSAQKRVTVSGYVRDIDSGEPIIGAVIYNEDKSVGVGTNESGFYSLPLASGPHTLFCSCVGYVDVEQSVELKSDKLKLDFEISEDKVQLEAAKVFSHTKKDMLKLPQMGAQLFDVAISKKLPALMGEADIIRVIQMLPGVQTPSEGSTGFSVRGGGVDQNLILMDGAPIYNSGHFLGFFSMFNSDAVKTAQLYKGDFPTKFGGKTSSVLDINTVDGNMKKFGGSASLGFIASKIFLEGPIVKDKLSLMFSARRSYVDIFFPLLKKYFSERTKLSFYDINAKLTWNVNDKNRVYVSAFSSDDVFGVALEQMGVELMTFDYSNNTQSIRWNHEFGPKLFSNLTLYNSFYSADIEGDMDLAPFDWQSKITETGLRYNCTWYISPKNTMEFGVNAAYFFLRPSETHPPKDKESVVQDVVSPYTHAVNPAVYIQNESKLGPLTFRYGVRYSAFTTFGETDQLYFNSWSHEYENTVHFDKWEIIKGYGRWEPRASASLSLSESSSLKASYSRSFQYVQQAVVSVSGSIADAWFTSSPNALPQQSDQYSVGLNKNFLDDALEFSVEGFYKHNRHTIDLKENPGLVIDNKYREGLLRFGTSDAYGAEFLLKYEFAKVNGWLGYTWSKCDYHMWRMIPGTDDYRSPITHQHAVNAVFSWDISNRVNASASWVFYSGAPTTYPALTFQYGGTYVPIYSSRNADSMPDYHRLDLSLTWKTKARLQEKRWSGEWNFSIYDAYARHNAWSISTGYNKIDKVTEARMIYIFTIIPSLSYNIKF